MKDNLPAIRPKLVLLDTAKQTLYDMRNIALIVFLHAMIHFNLQAQIEPNDIVITEMMIDPNPVVGLPNFEWVEFYNRTDQTIDLAGFQFSSGSSRSQLPSYNLPSGGFVMLCDDEDLAELSAFGSAIAIPTFPSLTNTGDVARIESPNDQLINEVIYDRSWYGSNDKDDGGYTLEIINPEEPCLAATNWTASESPTGGTPSSANSQWNPQAINPGVTIANTSVSRADQITLEFDRIPEFILSPNSFSFDPNIDIIDVSISIDDPRKVFLELSEVLTPSIEYELLISADIKDCAGKSSNVSQTVEIIRSEPVSPKDLIINEILFNPIGTGSDYVEVYNRSDKYLSSAGLQIGNIAPSGNAVIKNIGTTFSIPPGAYVVFTEDKTDLLNQFPSSDPASIFEIDLPSFNNDAGNITLINNQGIDPVIIDAFDYIEAIHNPLIDDADGIALERIDPEQETQLPSNWHSAASSTNYGTPTQVNSQLRLSSPTSSEHVYLARKTFFPEGHPTDELLRIVFELDRSDYIGEISIYDNLGNIVDHIANNVLLGRNDQYTWDGRSSNGALQNAGLYIIWIRLVTSDGKMITKKLPCVLSRSL